MNLVQCRNLLACVPLTCLLTLSMFFLPGGLNAADISSLEENELIQEEEITLSQEVETITLEEQRELFLDAEKAIRTGHLQKYRKLENQLEDYPLYSYLQAAEISRRISRTDDDEILSFLNTYDNTPPADRLRYKWLGVLLRKGRYEAVVENFRPTQNTSQLCRYAQALMNTERKEEGYELMSELWLNGRSLPDACNKPVRLLKNAGHLNNELIWGRIKLAMIRRNHQLASFIARQLPASDRQWLTLWKKIQRRPETIITQKNKFIETEENSSIVLSILSDGINRLARRQPVKAAQHWKNIKDQYNFETTVKEDIEHYLAQSLASVDTPVAFKAIQDLDITNASVEVISPHVFSALQNQEWSSALAWMEHLSEEEKNSERWQYWRARTLESMRYIRASHEIYLSISNNRSYYSFLAAERIGNSYEILHRPLNISEYKLLELKKKPALVRAYELFRLEKNLKARIEWNHAIKDMNREQLLMAAQLAGRWGWKNRSISTLAKAEYWDEVDLRFPLEHRERVEDEAREGGVNPAWAFAVIRQESAFVKDAKSSAGALGLMQLMPGTARYMARSMRIKRPRLNDLLKSDLNIRLGVNYLKKLQKDFSGNTVLATAAYNAGPSNVNRWLSNYEVANTDLWIETVPYAETREYLKRVMTYAVIYEQRLGLESSPMFKHIAPTDIDYTAAVF